MKRKDKKGRILRPNEYQRSDGRYEFRYHDRNGTKKSSYSWRLEAKDKTPAGRKAGLALRELEEQIQRNQILGIDNDGGGHTVKSLCERYAESKTNVSDATTAGYRCTINMLEQRSFGKKRICKVTVTDAKAFVRSLQNDGRSYNTIHNYVSLIRPAFQLAVEDNLILHNPFDWHLKDVIEKDASHRIAIEPDDEARFLSFIREDKTYHPYYDGILLMLRTGLRISELCGLTKNDFDLEHATLQVNRQLLYHQKKLYVAPPKSKSSKRTIPLTPEAVDCARRILSSRKKTLDETGVDPWVDGCAGFVFLNTNIRKEIRPMVAADWQRMFQRAIAKYNKRHPSTPLPHITPHVCRHTYCSNMAKSGMSPKTLQYLMGHSEIGVTMNVYTHLGLEDATEELRRVEDLNKARAELEKTTGQKPMKQTMFKAI